MMARSVLRKLDMVEQIRQGVEITEIGIDSQDETTQGRARHRR